jgi:hypothetical protein
MDPEVRVIFTVKHREDWPKGRNVGQAECQWVDPLTGVTCEHSKSCACHQYALAEQKAGVVDLFAHRFQTLTTNEMQDIAEGLPVPRLEVRYLSYVPGSAEWLTSPFPTRRQET